VIVQSFVVGSIVHGDFNRSPLFDGLWSASVNFETVAILPQLRMIATCSGKVDAVTWHFLACFVFAAVCRFEFWWYASAEFDSMVPAVHIVLMHMVQLALCGGFLFCSARAYINGDDIADELGAPKAEAKKTYPDPELIDFGDDMPCSWR